MAIALNIARTAALINLACGLNVRPTVFKPTTQCDEKPSEVPMCTALDTSKPIRIAVGFYGAQRSTPYTVESIRKNLFEPLDRASNGARDVFVHAMLMKEMGPSTRRVAGNAEEAGLKVCKTNLFLLSPCGYETHDQHEVDYQQGLLQLRDHATWDTDLWDGIGKQPEIAKPDVRLNVLRSRWSMKRVALMISTHEVVNGIRYTHAVMARPDIGFTTPLIWNPFKASASWVRVPDRHHWKGVNDRFAYGDRDTVVNWLLTEFDTFNTSVPWFGASSESKYCNYIRRHNIQVAVTPLCLVRVRATGEAVGADMHKRGNPIPDRCISAGLKFYKDDREHPDACAHISGKDLAEWGWKLPNLDDVLKFIHIPITAGTSLEAIGSFYKATWGKKMWDVQKAKRCAFGCPGTWHSCSPWHLPLAVFRNKKESGGINSLQKTFCVVRDPMMRAIGQYSFAIQAVSTPSTFIVNGSRGTCDAKGLNAHIKTLLGGAEQSLLRIQKDRNAFSVSPEALGNTSTCTACAAVADCHWIPQWMYVKDQCDHVLHFETLDEDFNALMKIYSSTVTERTVIRPDALSNHKKLHQPACDTLTVDDLDDHSRALLRRIYAEDMRMFGYGDSEQNTVGHEASEEDGATEGGNVSEGGEEDEEKGALSKFLDWLTHSWKLP